nr:late embryogenesis abundant protein 76 [Quercus suber]
MASHNQSYRADETKGRAEEKTNQTMGSLGDKAREGKDMAYEKTQEAKDYTNSAVGSLGEKAREGKDKTYETAEAAKEKTSSAAQSAKEKASQAAETVKSGPRESRGRQGGDRWDTPEDWGPSEEHGPRCARCFEAHCWHCHRR